MIVGGDKDFSTKSGKIKKLSLPSMLINLLKSYKSESTSKFLFPSKDGSNSIDPKVITKRFTRLTTKLNLENIVFHDFRATCATKLAELGLGDSAIAKQLGHSTIRMTRQYSNRIDMDVLVGATEQLSNSIQVM